MYSRTSNKCKTFLCRPINIMFLISFVAARLCLNQRRYLDGTAGMAMYAFKDLQFTVARSETAARINPVRFFANSNGVKGRALSGSLDLLGFVSSVPILPGTSSSKAGTGGGGCPAFTLSIASIMSSNSMSVALNGIWPHISIQRVRVSSRKSPVLGSTYDAIKLRRRPFFSDPRSIFKPAETTLAPSPLYRCNVLKLRLLGLTSHHTCRSSIGFNPRLTSLSMGSPFFTTTQSFRLSA
mmetsp:Transcript_34840/g.84265  ORF Transcript_34840/g.84265 Transcript_34840/m.84265 type:complete len:239 (+) Transcript_34840:1277-1993(+)